MVVVFGTLQTYLFNQNVLFKIESNYFNYRVSAFWADTLLIHLRTTKPRNIVFKEHKTRLPQRFVAFRIMKYRKYL